MSNSQIKGVTLEEYKKQQSVLNALKTTTRHVVLSFIVFNSCNDHAEGKWKAEIKMGGATDESSRSTMAFGKTPNEAMEGLKQILDRCPYPEVHNLDFSSFNFAALAKELMNKSLDPAPPTDPPSYK